jgi:hypothetical protein
MIGDFSVHLSIVGLENRWDCNRRVGVPHVLATSRASGDVYSTQPCIFFRAGMSFIMACMTLEGVVDSVGNADDYAICL